MQNALTKSKYLQYLSCPREFWLAHRFPEAFKAEETLLSRHLREQGYTFEREARRLSIFTRADSESLVEFGREFSTDRLYTKADAVITDRSTGRISIYEIKSSSKVKDEHLYDVAFQKNAAEACGLVVEAAYVITADSEYTRNGELDPEALFSVHDVTTEAIAKAAETEELITAAFACLETEPAPSVSGYCNAKLNCRFIRHYFPELPEYSVFDISRIHKNKLNALVESNIIDIVHVPDGFELSEKQRRQVTVAKSGEPDIDHAGIDARLAGLAFPLHFLDYETFSYAVPQFEGIRPFQQMAFQFSLHSVYEPGGEYTHTEFLSDGTGDPPLAMAESLRDAMAGGIGTVIVWSQGFENTINKRIGEKYPEFSDFFREIVEKTFDLRKIFSDQLYMHPEFKGRDSIKKVMPVLAPHLSYDGLEISEGMTASITWFHLATGRFGEEARAAVYENLRAYCKLDTWAMVEIFNVLRTGSADEASALNAVP